MHFLTLIPPENRDLKRSQPRKSPWKRGIRRLCLNCRFALIDQTSWLANGIKQSDWMRTFWLPSLTGNKEGDKTVRLRIHGTWNPVDQFSVLRDLGIRQNWFKSFLQRFQAESGYKAGFPNTHGLIKIILKPSIGEWNSVAIRWLGTCMTNDCNPFVLIVETSIKMMNVHMISCKT